MTKKGSKNVTRQTKPAKQGKQGNKDATAIGDFERPPATIASAHRDKLHINEDLLVAEGVGTKTIHDFMRGKRAQDVQNVQQMRQSRPTPNPTTATPTPTTATPTPTSDAVRDTDNTSVGATTGTDTSEAAVDATSREEELHKAIREIEESPELTYEQKLAKCDIDKARALHILDNMFVQGYHEETYKITGNVLVTFRTRKTMDQDRLLNRIEAENPQFPATVSNLVSQYNLAASIQHYMDKDFSDAGFKERFHFVSDLPDTILRLLCIKLAKFDSMILCVLDEGAIENF